MIGEYIYVMKMREVRLTTDVAPGASLSGVRRNTALAVPTRRLHGKTKQKQSRHNREPLHKEQQTQTRYGGWTDNNLLASQSNMQFSEKKK